MPHVSVTGLRLRGFWHAPRFWWLTLAALAQARRAPGLIHLDVRRIDGWHHTLTVWEDEQSMRQYLRAGAHLASMRAFSRIATGKVLGFASAGVPDWSEAHGRWLREGRVVGR